MISCDDCAADAVEHLLKAVAEGDDRSIWLPHENPFLTTHVEDVTRRFQAILERIMDALAQLLLGQPIGELGKAFVPWERWSPERMLQGRDLLESKPPIATASTTGCSSPNG